MCKKGFSLFELILVFVILCFLFVGFAMAAPNLSVYDDGGAGQHVGILIGSDLIFNEQNGILIFIGTQSNLYYADWECQILAFIDASESSLILEPLIYLGGNGMLYDPGRIFPGFVGPRPQEWYQLVNHSRVLVPDPRKDLYKAEEVIIEGVSSPLKYPLKVVFE